MTTSTITNTITSLDGTTAIEGVEVVVRLMPAGGWVTSSGAEMIREYRTRTNSSGVWSLSLQRNSDITPANTYYEVTENIPKQYGGPRRNNISVGSSNQTLYAALITTPPSVPVANYLTQDAADARYVLSPGSFGAAGSLAESRPGDTASGGVLSSYARTDHRHDREQIYGTAAARAALTGTDLFDGLHYVESDTGDVYIRKSSTWYRVVRDLTTVDATWTSYTPTLSQGVSTNINKTTTHSRYMRIGRLIVWQFDISATGAGTAGSPITLSPPVTPAISNANVNPCGTAYYQDAGVAQYMLTSSINNTSIAFVRGDITPANYFGADPNFAVANTDRLAGQVIYEAAS